MSGAVQYVLLLYASAVEDPAIRDRTFHRLAPPESATTVRRRGGSTLLCDGPAAEVREPLRGLVVIEARDLDEAIAVAQRSSHASAGAVEIRPVRESP